MCNKSINIKFCNCIEDSIQFREMDCFKNIKGKMINIYEKENKDIPLMYVWQLFKYNGKTNLKLEGEYILPENEIANGLNSEWIVLNLNNENCFDFEYQPSEGDNLKISQNVYNSPYLSFVFQNNEWVIAHYSSFSSDLELINIGKLKQL